MSDAMDLDCLPGATAPTGVLLIEDSEDAMLWVQSALQQYGNARYHLEWAKDLAEGVDQISKGGVDMVLLDLGLPDGAGAWSYFRIHQVAPEIPILVLTGNLREETEFAVIARGAYDYLVKDQLSRPLLVQAIQAAFDSIHQRAQHQILKLALDTKATPELPSESASGVAGGENGVIVSDEDVIVVDAKIPVETGKELQDDPAMITPEPVDTLIQAATSDADLGIEQLYLPYGLL